MVIPVERIPGGGEEEGFGDDATSSVEYPGEPSHMSLSDRFPSAHTRRSRSLPPSPARARSH